MNATSAVSMFLAVVSRVWLTNDQPELHLTLSDGSTVKIQWDLSYAFAALFVAAPGADFVSCTAAETGIDPDELAGFVESVYRAVVADENERLADQWNEEDR